MTRMLLASLALALCTGAGLTGAAAAEDTVTVEANVALTTDYRFRGASLSDETIALQGGFDVSFASGFYLGSWASSIEPVGNSELELDLYAGYGGTVGVLDFAIGALVYTYPGSTDTSYYEVYGSLSGTAGLVTSTVGFNYSPEQDNIGGDDNLYLYYGAEMPLGETGLTLSGGLGYETGAFGDLDGDGDEKIDWTVAVGWSAYGVDLALAYVDTTEDTDGSDATGVFTISKAF